MSSDNLAYKFLFVVLLVAGSIFLLYPKPETWADSNNKFQDRVADMHMRLGIDLQGGTRLEYEIPEEQRATFEGANAMTRLLQVLSKRIDNLGVLEPKIESTGKYRFVIELPGISPELVQRVKTLMEKQGKLEFKLTANLDNNPELDREHTRILQEIPALEQSYPVPGVAANRREQGAMVARAINQNVLKPSLKTQWRYYFHYEERVDSTIEEYRLVSDQVEISGTDIQSAQSSASALGSVPGFTLKPKARTKFCNITKAHREGGGDERRLAIILDDRLVSAPTIRSEICDGSAIIDGDYTFEEVEDMVNVFSSGELAAVPQLLREETTGPSIGLAAQRYGVIAAVIGMALIILFMFVYYLNAGVVANIALISNAILIGGVLSFFQATLTLPGVAGLILTIGMAVDANILIFERIREEAAKGKTLAQAILNGYDRAFITIFDANLTTLITAAILFWFGTGSVQGFALTLIVGIATSMFTALFVTRIFFTLLVSQNMVKELKMLNLVGRPSINFIGMSGGAAMLSFVLVIGSLVFYGASFDRVQGIDLKGGTAFRMSAESAITRDQALEELRQVQDRVNGWIASGEWMDILQLEAPTDGSPGPATPAQDPLADAWPQGLTVDATDSRPKPEPGHYYEFMVRSRTLEDDAYELVRSALKQGGEGLPAMDIKEKTEISSKIAQETALNALVAILFAIGAILIYITMRFEFHFGLGAVLALVHDVGISLGVITLFNTTGLVDIEINLPIIAALLTVIGYSLNDTIVVYDRIRENLKGSHKVSLELLNSSINQTLARTVLTSLTTLIVVGVLFALNYGRGSIVEGFSFTLLIGVVVGTYSSVFVASPFLLFWQKRIASSEKKS